MARIDDEVKSRFSSEQHRFVTNLIYTAGWVNNSFTEFLRPYGISGQQFNILRILRGYGDWLAMTEVKDRMIEKAPNATRLADKLLAKKLIERKRSDTDRRVVFVRVTKIGLDLLDHINEKPSKVSKSLMGNVSDEEARIVSDILDKFRG